MKGEVLELLMTIDSLCLWLCRSWVSTVSEKGRWRIFEMHRAIYLMRSLLWIVIAIFALGSPRGEWVFVSWVLYLAITLGLIRLTPVKLGQINLLMIPLDVILITYGITLTGGLSSQLYILYGAEAIFLTAYGALRGSSIGSVGVILIYGLVTNGWDSRIFWWRAIILGLLILFSGFLGVAFRRTRSYAKINYQRLEQISSLKALQELVVGEEDIATVLSTLLANASGLVGATVGYVAELTPHGNLIPLALYGINRDQLDPLGYVYENSVEAWALKRRTLGIHALKDVDSTVNDHRLAEIGVKEIAVAALTDKNHMVGMLVLGTQKFSDPAPDAAVETLSDIIINQLRYDSAKREAQKRGRLLTVLERVGRIVNRTMEMSVLLKTLHEEVAEELQTDSFFVALNIPNDPEHALMRYLYDDGEEYPPEILPVTPGGPTATVLATGEPKIFHGNVDNATLTGSKREPRGMLVAPLVHEGRIIGAISAQSYHKEYDADHLEFLSAIASQASIAIQNAQLYQATQAIALTDHLTGLANARQFSLILSSAIEHAFGTRQPLSLLVIDSDSLKQINDRYGHTAGDAHLTMLSQAIQRNVRDNDTPCRYAGDEFVIILPGSCVDEAVTVGERIRQEMDQRFAWRDAGMISVTISVGAAELKPGMTGDELFSAADRAMYFAKHGGKNQVVAV